MLSYQTYDKKGNIINEKKNQSLAKFIHKEKKENIRYKQITRIKY